ncbi:MAG: M48 family metalloprotease [Cyanobacteria bacterium CRU_2_1]|nr:M48 family metalloprotease [Cyanobacteria bacterium RU_5_0]NJR58319.1 M48 family metalloprotease [Cyanobacteria bacterium CRU_2_1]
MSNFSDSSHTGASFPDRHSDRSESASSLQSHLQVGLAALRRKAYPEAIVHLEVVYHNAADPASRFKAQMGLVKAYARVGKVESAVDLCWPLRDSTNQQVRTWANQTLEQLAHRSPLSNPVSEQSSPDATGFTPLKQSPSAKPAPPKHEAEVREVSQPVAQPKDTQPRKPNQRVPRDTGFGEVDRPSLETDEGSFLFDLYDEGDPDATFLQMEFDPQESAIKQATEELMAARENGAEAEDINATATPDSFTLAEVLDSEIGADSPPIETTIQPNEAAPIWRKAGRAQKWSGLGKVDPTKLWALEVGTVGVLFWVICTFLQVCQGLVNWVLEDFPFINLRQFVRYNDPAWGVAIALILLFAASPWLLNLILKRVYRLKPLTREQLELFSPEACRLLRRVSNQRHQPFPRLGILSMSAPIVFTYGHLPRNAQIVASQGLLERLNDDEIATLYAAELGHIGYWDFGVMSGLTLIAQLPYLLYWHMAEWGNRQRNLVFQTITVVIASAAYGIYKLVRLPGLWLSRVRLYYSDRAAVELTGNPNALTRALLKIAMGTAEIIQQQTYTAPLLESIDLLIPVGHRTALSLGSLSSNAPTPAVLEWDRSNPHRRWLAINNAHPPLGDRLNLLSLYARHWRLDTELGWHVGAQERQGQDNLQSPPLPHSPTFSPSTRRRLLLQGAPFFGILIGLIMAGGLCLAGWVAEQVRWITIDWLWDDRDVILVGCALIGFGIGMIMRINPSFPDIRRSNLRVDPSLTDLLSNPTAMPIDSLPVRMHGTLLGRRGVLNWLYPDLILHTQTGSVRLHFTSSWGILGNLLNFSLRPTAFLNSRVLVTGWFRRGATPWIDVETIRTKRAIVRSGHPLLSTLLACLSALLGIYIIFRGEL